MVQHLTEDEINEIRQLSRNANQFGFPFGPQSSFILSNTYHILLEVSGSLHDILEQNTVDWKRQMMADLLQAYVVPNHLKATVQLFQKATERLRYLNDPLVTANIEFNIKNQEGKEKRLMMQLCIIQHPNSQLNHIILGNLVDISHFIKEGSPRLILLLGNKVIERDVPTAEDILKNESLQITPKELNILTLKAKGMRGKEIAETLGISLLTVYSMTRDIKQKSNMDIYPLIQKLKEKGLMGLYCGHLLYEEMVNNTMVNHLFS
jgi:DNA-binding CsgD family transcriptional regulator